MGGLRANGADGPGGTNGYPGQPAQHLTSGDELADKMP